MPLHAGTASVTQPQLRFVVANRLPGLGTAGDGLEVYFGQSYVTGCIMCSQIAPRNVGSRARQTLTRAGGHDDNTHSIRHNVCLYTNRCLYNEMNRFAEVVF